MFVKIIPNFSSLGHHMSAHLLRALQITNPEGRKALDHGMVAAFKQLI